MLNNSNKWQPGKGQDTGPRVARGWSGWGGEGEAAAEGHKAILGGDGNVLYLSELIQLHTLKEEFYLNKLYFKSNFSQ